MALIYVSDCLLNDEVCFESLMSGFDKIEKIGKKDYDVTVFRVYHEEVTRDDKVITPSFIKFEGILPFIIEFDIE